MTRTRRHPRKPSKPGRIPAMATWRHADADLDSSPRVAYRPATRIIPRDRRLEQKLVRRIPA
jgi:hypothetical protein